MSRITEDIVKKRQLLKSRLEGKLTEENLAPEQQRKKPPTRLHIPTIFQGRSVENLTTADNLPKQNISLSRSIGNLFKTAAWQVRKSQAEDVDKTTVRPIRKLSTSFSLKSDDSVKEIRCIRPDTVRKLSSSFCGKLISDEDRKCQQEDGNISKDTKEDYVRKVRPLNLEGSTSHPVIISSIKKQNINENNSSQIAKDLTTVDDGVILRRKLKSPRPKSETSPVLSPIMCFNFTDKPTSPMSPGNIKSPLGFEKLETNSNLKRSGSRIGFMTLKEITDNDKPFQKSGSLQNLNCLYENSNTKLINHQETNNKNIPLSIFSKNVTANKLNTNIVNDIEHYSKENEVVYANIEIFRRNDCYSKKFVMGPIYKIPVPSRRNILRK